MRFAREALGGALAALLSAGCGAGAGGSAGAAVAPSDRPSGLAHVAAEGERKALADLPGGDGRAVLGEACLLCHGATMIEQQHKDSAAWTKTVALMRGWGAPVPDDQVSVLLAYLDRNFGRVAR